MEAYQLDMGFCHTSDSMFCRNLLSNLVVGKNKEKTNLLALKIHPSFHCQDYYLRIFSESNYIAHCLACN